MDVSEAIKMKRAIRQFKPQPLSRHEVETILRAGRRAQSSKNTQPWTFLAIQDSRLHAVSGLGFGDWVMHCHNL
jgi:nitroreductase